MKFLADESVEGIVVASRRELGQDVLAISEIDPGADDRDVLQRAARDSRILITNDKDFAYLTFMQRQASAGIILVRMPKSRSGAKARRIREVVVQDATSLHGVMTVIQERILRRRAFSRTRSPRPD